MPGRKPVEEIIEKRRHKLSKLYIAIYGVMIITTVFFFGLVSLLTNESMKYKHTEMIADLYLKATDYDTAIDLYEAYKKDRLWGPGSDLANYQLARLSALKGDKQKSLLLLQRLSVQTYGKRAEQDSGFDSIRSSPEFQQYLRKLKAS